MTRYAVFSAAAALACALSLNAPAARAQTQAVDRARVASEIESLRGQIKEKEAALLAPSAADLERHAEFLAQPGTGLVRLLPRDKWQNKLSMSGGGAYYSFAHLTHEYGRGSDIELDGERLTVGFAGANFGFMSNLGDVPLETVSAETDAVQFMASFKTPSAEPEARTSFRQFAHGDGHQAGPWTYRRTLPAVVGNTYALRSVNYHESDVLVAFRVVRKDTDGSIIVLWKMLKKYPKPALERNVAEQ